ncbi:porin family protein [Maribacter thermophilus]|uniref:porin family protein n=1 Tax=Maribacter thermophilus TaxID=1197874 RepID=UPI000A01FC8B|nr:porin family protein [Maribacter thermophilus]
MKTKLLIIFLIVSSTTLFSQEKTKMALRMGLNSSKVLNSNLHTKYAPYAGVALAIAFNETYTLQPEITYSKQGGKSEIPELDDIDINYLSVSVANKIFTEGGHFHFILGPSIDFNFNDNFINLINSDGDNFEVTPIDLAAFGGIGIEFDFGLALELRYKQGLIDLDFNDDGEYGNNNENNQLNRVIQIGALYKLNF